MQKKMPTHEVKTKQMGPETHRIFTGARAPGLDLTAIQKCKEAAGYILMG
jgi:hypothetical protein